MKNRERWTITGIAVDGTINAIRTGSKDEAVRLPASYVQQHVQLGYRGRTVDHALLVLDNPTNSPGIYVALTRGRHSNTAYVTAPDHPTALDTLTSAVTNKWIDQPARVRQHELGTQQRLPGQLPRTETDRLQQRQAQLAQIINSAGPELGRARRQLNKLTTDRPNIVDNLDATREQLEGAKATIGNYDRPLQRRKDRAAIDNAKKNIEKLPGQITGLEDDLAAATQTVAKLTGRIAQLENVNTRLPDLTGEYDASAEQLHDLTGMDRRTTPRQILVQELHDRPTRPSNQDLIDALDRATATRPDSPDLGISL